MLLVLSDQQIAMLRLVDVATFCDPKTAFDFGRREIITWLDELLSEQ